MRRSEIPEAMLAVLPIVLLVVGLNVAMFIDEARTVTFILIALGVIVVGAFFSGLER